MQRNRALTVVLTLMMALWMTMGSAYGAAADTCEGYENKEEVAASGSGTFDVTSDGENIGTITWDNDADPENVSWSVDDGYSLDVCVKGSDALATGSGQSGTLTPPENDGGETPDVSHFAWTVQVIAPSDGETEQPANGGNDNNDNNNQDNDDQDTNNQDDNQVAASDDTRNQDNNQVAANDGDSGVMSESDARDGEDVEVAAADDDATAQVAQVPAGAADTGGGSTSGVENAQLFAIGLTLLAAAGSTVLFARKAGRSA